MKYYIYCYDIQCDKKRLRCAKFLLRYGERIQESVYQIAVQKHSQITTINNYLSKQINNDIDKVHYYYIANKHHNLCQTLSIPLSPAIKKIPLFSIY
jgi:CRISPR-associated protein Cas2